jgi:type IV secretion system protein VirB10
MSDKVQSVVGNKKPANRDRSTLNVSGRKEKKTVFLGIVCVVVLATISGVIGYKLFGDDDTAPESEAVTEAVSNFEAGKVDSVVQESDKQIAQMVLEQKAQAEKEAKAAVSQEAAELEKQKQALAAMMAEYKKMQDGGSQVTRTTSDGRVVGNQPTPRVSPPPRQSPQGSRDKKELTPEMRKRQGSVTIELASSKQQTSPPPPNYDDSFNASHFESGVAGLRRRGELDFMLIHGTSIPCALYTQIISDYDGFVTCRVTQDVYSANGAALLIERGSLVSGTQNVAIEQGQARIFTHWADIETPQGVSVRLDSLGAGALGAAGSEAWVDNHFAERFGGAIMLSFIDDALAAVSQQASNNELSVDNSTENAEDMASKALEASINIKPTGYAYIGQRINILVARDIDMSSVYQFGEEYEY